LSFRRPAWKLSRAFPEGAQPISTASPCNKIHAADAGCGGCTVAVAETGDEAIVGGSEGAEGQSGHRLSVSRKSLIETHCLRGLAKQCIHWKFNFEICRRKTRAARCYGCLCRALGWRLKLEKKKEKRQMKKIKDFETTTLDCIHYRRNKAVKKPPNLTSALCVILTSVVTLTWAYTFLSASSTCPFTYQCWGPPHGLAQCTDMCLTDLVENR